MKFAAALLSLPLIASAAPLAKRNNGGGKPNIDVVILQYALTLEHLEDTFYKQALAQYSESDFTSAGFDSSVRERIQMISSDEATHVSFLQTALSGLGETPTAACEYNFGYTDVKSFLATSSILEGVGVSAYLGAAAAITSGDYLTAAGAILTVESRHSAYIRNTIGQSPFPAPFDIPLDFNEVYSLASLFITSCPDSNPTLPVKAFPALTAAVQGSSSAPGGMVTLTPPQGFEFPSGPIYAAFIGFPTNAYGAYNTETKTVTIPEGFSGQTYVVLSTSDSSVSDDTTIAGPAVFEITPSM